LNYKDGGRGIRTPGTVPRTAVFKTAGFNHSPIPPTSSLTLRGGKFQILDGEILLAIRFLRAQPKRARYRIGVFDRNSSSVGLTLDGHETVLFGFDFELLTIFQ